MTLEITGNTGTQTPDVHQRNGCLGAIAYAINTVSDSTGITANLLNPSTATSGITFSSSGYGSQSFVSVQAQTGAFGTIDTKGNAQTRTVGRDAVATVNGALTTGNGLELQLNTSSLDLDLYARQELRASGKTSFAITNGGALFQLGSQVTSNQQVSIVHRIRRRPTSLATAMSVFLSDLSTGGTASLVSGHASAAASSNYRSSDHTGIR